MNFNQLCTIKQIYRRTNRFGDHVTRVKLEKLADGSIMMHVWHEFTHHWFGKHSTIFVIGKRGAVRRETKVY